MGRNKHPPANLEAENRRLRSDVVALRHTLKVLAPDIISNLAIILVQLQAMD